MGADFIADKNGEFEVEVTFENGETLPILLTDLEPEQEIYKEGDMRINWEEDPIGLDWDDVVEYYVTKGHER